MLFGTLAVAHRLIELDQLFVRFDMPRVFLERRHKPVNGILLLSQAEENAPQLIAWRPGPPGFCPE